MSEPLRTRDGATPRVALLVYNDAQADARVLKTAATLRHHGCEVRIFAVAREGSGRAAGTQVLPDGVTRVRVREFALAASLPRVAGLYQRLLVRVRPTPTPFISPEASWRSGSARERKGSSDRHDAPGEKVAGGLRSRIVDLGMRIYLAVSLATYWRNAIAEGIAFHPDVIHANDGNTLYPAMRIARHTGARIVYDTHELWRHRNVRHRPIGQHIDHLMERVGVRRAASVVAVSPSIAEWLYRTYRLPRRPVLVRNVPAAGPVPDPSNGLLRQRAGLGAEPVIAYGGRITTSRGIEETIDALAYMPGAHLVILGYGEHDYLAVVRRRALKTGVADRVHLIGEVPADQVSTALADADLAVVYVQPTCLSYEYSLPNKLFESIHAGLPIVAADLPDTKAVVLEHGVGEVFTVDGGAEQMAAVMQRVLADPQPYRNASRTAATVLTWERESVELLAEYRRVLA